ncbi:hypothetical protein L210DRAFT_3506214 [Boletus edulis BED1]|uniref:Uncharacterized protein n=1 Tax=Boletus edulis BED1 TaxID=1328754 RepID=A0AAD4BNM2_BOLED|nr:hypothetical protein L210DRAFT_3506214 [Boletus edulis BED1]
MYLPPLNPAPVWLPDMDMVRMLTSIDSSTTVFANRGLAHPVVNEVPKSSASPLYFRPWDSGDPDMGPLCISREIGREMWKGLREGKTPGMSESIVGAKGKAMTWTDRQCGKGLL